MSVKMTIFVGGYFFFCVLVAIGARKTILGFWGGLFLSLLLTPFTPAFLILIFRRN